MLSKKKVCYLTTIVGVLVTAISNDLADFSLVNEHRRSGAQKGATDPFLGLLYPVEDHKVFGYISNTNAKLIVGLRRVMAAG